jgi:hypothetical protein
MRFHPEGQQEDPLEHTPGEVAADHDERRGRKRPAETEAPRPPPERWVDEVEAVIEHVA